jgi:hypothetical protein
MSKYIVKFTRTFACEIVVDADNQQEAIDLAMANADAATQQFSGSDYFEAEPLTDENARELKDSGLPEDNDGKLIDELVRRGYIRVLWHQADIRKQAEDMDVKLSDETVSNIAEALVDTFDATVGVNWDVIEQAILWHIEA